MDKVGKRNIVNMDGQDIQDKDLLMRLFCGHRSFILSILPIHVDFRRDALALPDLVVSLDNSVNRGDVVL